MICKPTSSPFEETEEQRALARAQKAAVAQIARRRLHESCIRQLLNRDLRAKVLRARHVGKLSPVDLAEKFHLTRESLNYLDPEFDAVASILDAADKLKRVNDIVAADPAYTKPR